MARWLVRELGRPPVGEEVYGRPAAAGTPAFEE